MALAQAAFTGLGVDNCSNLGISLRDARRDLGQLLPADLFELVSCQGRVHQLNLSPTDIALLLVSLSENVDHVGRQPRPMQTEP